jgi:hypothetical protein
MASQVIEEITKLINKPDKDFFLTLLNSDGNAKKLPLDKKLEILENTYKVSQDFYNELVKNFKEQKPSEYASILGVPVIYVNEEDSYNYNYIGLYSEKYKNISVNLYVINRIKNAIKDYGLDQIVDAEIINQVVIGHELFHYMQTLHPNAYIEQKQFDMKLFGIFKMKTKYLVLEEIAAIYFSKIITKLPYNPLVYNKINAKSKAK